MIKSRHLRTALAAAAIGLLPAQALAVSALAIGVTGNPREGIAIGYAYNFEIRVGSETKRPAKMPGLQDGAQGGAPVQADRHHTERLCRHSLRSEERFTRHGLGGCRDARGGAIARDGCLPESGRRAADLLQSQYNEM